ncbi:DnaJ-like protein DjlA [Candidatus Gullanella endobia]|uniref:DnaJ-like protein DjlA n=1 Tax=Candidatus Gullanella endobia TaxID=1070130 RepID=A0A143WQR9_9ENTR|nr:co-chaperone DjlA [Candidatus Gullanella endobia]CUX96084.1 DnaJ-like protein DjlA [Candidatus Gullanella endobia]
MRYWGNLLGIILPILAGGSFWALILGLLIGYIVDRVKDISIVTNSNYFSDQQICQETKKKIFLCTTFQVMGYLTKSKGRVTKVDIINANNVMVRMNLNDSLKKIAQEAFREGKNSNFSLRHQLHEFRQICLGSFDFKRMFLEIQIQAAFADGSLHPNERQILYLIAEELSINRSQFYEFISMIEGSTQFSEQQESYQSEYCKTEQSHQSMLEDACKTLGVIPQDDTQKIKRAYRKLMSENHPDKLIAKGLSPQRIEMAKKKTQTIQKAYNFLKREKRFR